MRILHTSDWHLGHTLLGLGREHEHRRFLSFLLDTLEAERADALLVTGDVFDAASPPTSAQAEYFRFLAKLAGRLPRLEVVVIAGNHDSPSRLDAPAPILEALRVRVIGGLPRDQAGGLAIEKLVVPLHAADGSVGAWLAAVPFLRSAELPPFPEAEDPLVAGVRAIYDELLGEARAKRQPGQALLCTGHAYLAGGALSELSERKILGGNQHALPAELFPDDVAYVALGHLHKAQDVGGRAALHYAGSPLPLSFGEVDYLHQVALVELSGERLASVRAIPVPRAVELLRIPPAGPAPLAEILPLLAALPEAAGVPEEERPWLEVRVALTAHVPELRRKLTEALEGKAARLVSLTQHATGTGQALGDAKPARRLDELRFEEVFVLLYQQQHQTPPPPALLAALHELAGSLEAAEGGASQQPAATAEARAR